MKKEDPKATEIELERERLDLRAILEAENDRFDYRVMRGKVNPRF